MSQTVPARLHVLLARRARLGVVFRRGPTRQVATLLWNLDDDSLQRGQWLHGTIYERRADLSPDGRYMILFAGRHSRAGGETGGTWTAVSRAPWLTALDLWAKGDAWQGGGLFVDARSYWLNGCHRPLRLSGVLRRVDAAPIGPQPSGECLGLYIPRLLRDGWRLTARAPWRCDLVRSLAHGWRLHKLVHASVPPPPGRRVYWEEHLAESACGQRIEAGPDWEWADRDGGDILYAADGCLWRLPVRSHSALGAPARLADLTPMRFEAVPAPY